MFHVGTLQVVAFQILVQDGEYLRVQHLEAPDPVHHAFQVLRGKGDLIEVTWRSD